jgi:hypothetical protein
MYAAAALLPVEKSNTFVCLQVPEGNAWAFVFVSEPPTSHVSRFQRHLSPFFLSLITVQVIDKFNETSISA